MTNLETGTRDMHQRSEDAKSDFVDALMRRGLSRDDARTLVDKLSSVTPAEHSAARAEISNVLEFRRA
ncbi:hypothetical protein ABZ357_10845 [Streptomyces sp. NPDC005917]|uniref:hypothetical protein n=1 Tax=unclassified Streptomyces TaxID=2593676 RepID=UPI0033CC6815